MDYKTLIAKTATSAGVSRAETGKVVAALRSEILEALKTGDNVKIANFGTFKMVRHNPTQRRDPNTHQIKSIPERVKPKFTFSLFAQNEVSV